MKILDSYEMNGKFIDNFVRQSVENDPNMCYLIERLISGIITQEKSSGLKIHNELVQAESQRTYYRQIHRLAQKMPEYFMNIISQIQQESKISMKSDGVLSIDEHIIPHTSSKMEGVDYFHKTSHEKPILAHSIISTHYFRNGIEYPVSFQFYRRERELEKWDKIEAFQEKNVIARQELEKICAFKNSPKIILMDSYFMTKENCQFLQEKQKIYISRPKRSWKGSYNHKRQSLSEIYESIPNDEFKKTIVKNPKTGKKTEYQTAVRDMFFPKIGTHRVIFLKLNRNISIGDDLFHNVEEDTDSRGYKFRVFITNDLSKSADEILSCYSLRWTIETGYRDMSQNLGIHGCIWRELSGQYCFIALSFLCYVFLMWAKNLGAFSRYGVNLETLGQLKYAYRHYCQEVFSLWLGEIKQQCSECKMANWIFENVFIG